MVDNPGALTQIYIQTLVKTKPYIYRHSDEKT